MQSYWKTLLTRDATLTGIVVLAALNGSAYSALFDPVAFFLYGFTRGSALISHNVLYYLSTILIAVVTLSVGGIPAALYERIRGLPKSTPVSLGIWLVATGLLALPTIMVLLGED
jgi:hypothetical protein